MKALIDINILLDVILRREPHFEESRRVIDCCISLVDGYVALHSFATLFYVLHEREHKDIEYCRTVISNFLYLFDVATLNREELLKAINNANFSDLEDSMQHESALSCSVDCIVTRDKDDFSNANIPVFNPEQFLELVKSDRLGM